MAKKNASRVSSYHASRAGEYLCAKLQFLFPKKNDSARETFFMSARLPNKEKKHIIFTTLFVSLFFIKGVAMKKQYFSTLLFAIIFAIMPAFLAAQSTVSPQNDIATLRKAIGYPQWAINRQIEGRFVMEVYVGNNGEVAMVNFDAINSTPEITPLIAEVSQKIYEYRFSPELAGQTLRIPFRFALTK